MKKYILTSILATLLLTVGCNDQLERFPVDSLVEETAYQSVSDLESGMIGALGSLNFSPLIGFNAIFTDNSKLGDNNGGQQLNLLNQILNGQTGDQGTWTNRYGAINNFNRVLVGAEGITPDANERSRYNNVIGQSLAFRAYMHYELLLYYGFNFMDASAPGIPYQNSVSTDDLPSRLTTGEVIAAIEADLNQASTLITDTDVNYATDDFITFLRARIALYSGDFDRAITFANALIAKYPLANTTQYFAMFNGDSDLTEIVFKFDNVQGFNRNLAGNFIFTGTGGSFIEMSNSLFDLLDPTDIRRSVILDPTSDPLDNKHYIGKYPPGGDTNYINDYKAMRISEMYLIRAEAHARKTSPDFASASDDVQAIRNARYSSPPGAVTYTTVVEAINDIKKERRIELAFEGHRYIDIKRYKDILNQGITRDAIDCLGSVPCTLPVSSEKFIFPLPLSETNANNNIAQAPGY